MTEVPGSWLVQFGIEIEIESTGIVVVSSPCHLMAQEMVESEETVELRSMYVAQKVKPASCVLNFVNSKYQPICLDAKFSCVSEGVEHLYIYSMNTTPNG